MSEKVPFYESVAKKTPAKKNGKAKNKAEPAFKTGKKAALENAGRNNPKASAVQQKKARIENGRTFAYEISENIFGQFSKDSKTIISSFDEIVQSVSPLNSKQFCALPHKIKELSHDLTDTRNMRRLGYMNSKEYLSAYVRYFAWWNLFRLCSVFESFESDAFAFLKDGDVILDIGSGPLTAVIALWLARPELRAKKLNVVAVDLSSGALSLGEELFLAVAARTCSQNEMPWHITRIKGTFGTEIREKASFIICANMFNELLQDSQKPIEEDVKICQKKLLSYAAEKSAFFIAEPGVPRGSRFVSLIRDGFIRKGFAISSPCPHCSECVFAGTKNAKWCHFVRSTEDAPKPLLKRSEDAMLSKDRATISFVFASPQKKSAKPETEKGELFVRIVSDEIKLPYGRQGRYGCSKWGAVLLTGRPLKLVSGSLVCIKINENQKKFLQKDKKTGFLMIELS